ncbi:putative LRR receptor-like serine/threonine-protein kinase, partial [Ananas comosus]
MSEEAATIPTLILLILSSILITGHVIEGLSDKVVIAQLKQFLQEHNPINRGGYAEWDVSEPTPCNWSGISCDGATKRVVGVDLSSSNISGPVFGNFSLLTALARLDLSANTIDGTLPADLNSCRGLRYLNISHNLISGVLNVSGLANLEILDVSLNRFEGPIAVNFPAGCASLSVLNVSTNKFTGEIAGVFDECEQLRYLDLSSNHFSGEIWQGFDSLREFSVAENNLTGEILPGAFTANCALETLDLSDNSISGAFPNSIANCSKLNFLSLSENGFGGAIPSGIGKLSELESLFLGNNRFARDVPEELLNCSKLVFLDLNGNNFGGEVQVIFGRFVTVKFLVLHGNNYTGGIEKSGILKLPEVSRLDLSFNSFSGPLPASIAEMRKLKFLILAYNNFTGRIPAEYGNIAGLQALDLSFNELSGEIPPSIGNLTSLLWLMLANNQLTGGIPPELGNCTSLLWVNLAGNRLAGVIPPEIAKMGRDPEPTFATNREETGVAAGSGECLTMKRWLPANYPPFSFMYAVMTRKSCRTTWDRLLKGFGIIPVCLNTSSPVWTLAISGYLQLSGNLLAGGVPPEIGGMRNLSLLHLDDNRLSGGLPREVGGIPLVSLNVSNNRFSGEIPSELGGIRCLEILDLSRNNFSGEFPASLNALAGLSKFNVSFNPRLSGVVSLTGQMATFYLNSFLGDPNISFSSPAGGSPAQPPRGGGAAAASRRAARKVAFCVFVALTSAILTCGIISFVLCLGVRTPVGPGPYPEEHLVKQRSHKAWSPASVSAAGSSSRPSDGIRVFRLDRTAFTYSDIVTATGNFSADLVIGRGGYGVVYRGVLPDGRHVAVKKLERWGDDGGGEGEGEREFRAEMEVLAGRTGAGWPHPNLVPLYGWCLYGSAKLLVYEYMEGGCLESVIADWALFGWEHRLETAVGVARALVFLHHECRPAVVHRDLKASNVLLDSRGTARVTDFGLARVVGPGETHVSTVVAGTVGYVAPEYGHTWQATTRGDVYSYGVLAMELATGRRAVDGGEECLVEWGRRVGRDEA